MNLKMSRAKWKGPYLDNSLVNSLNKNDKTDVYTKSRKSTIIPGFVNKTICVHNGKNFLKIKITENMIGKKLGEFSPTRKKFSFKKKLK